jgi:adenosylhomocysteine nucleosidase
MESYAVAAVAAEAGVPFVAVRAIADPAEQPLPRAVTGIIGPDGMPRLDRLVLRLCLRPWECPSLFRLRRDTDAALASLGRLVGGLGPAGLV